MANGQEKSWPKRKQKADARHGPKALIYFDNRNNGNSSGFSRNLQLSLCVRLVFVHFSNDFRRILAL